MTSNQTECREQKKRNQNTKERKLTLHHPDRPSDERSEGAEIGVTFPPN